MAEVAGLVVGGISLAALFDQCVSILRYVDSGRSCGAEYQDAALMLTLLGARLTRWETVVRERSDTGLASEEDGENAEHWLRQIRKRLEEAEKLGERYSKLNPNDQTASAPEQSKLFMRSGVPSLVEKLQAKVLARKGSMSFAKRARWALFDQEKMTALIQKLDQLVGSLEQLFPTLNDQRAAIAKADVLATLDDTSESDLHQSEALQRLKTAAAQVDPDFDIAARSTSKSYLDIVVIDKALVSTGDYYSEGWAQAGGAIGQGAAHSYQGFRIGGDAKVQMGDSFGGRNVFGN